jgi:hypothetical protein
MYDSNQGPDAGRPPSPSDGYEQLPVDPRVTAVRLGDGGRDFIRIVVMNEQQVAPYAPLTEHYFGDLSLGIEGVTSFTLSMETIDPTLAAIEGFVGGFTPLFVIPQTAQFSRGVHAPTGDRRRLYCAADPDDATKTLGLLLEQSAGGALTRITWYKAIDTSVAFRQLRGPLPFKVVRDGSGKPTTDPGAMGGWTWYHATHPAA